MFARINFLLGLGLLILTVFYFAGVYLIVLPLSAIAPVLVKPAAGIAILVGVGVTVQLLSMAMSNFRGIALYANEERASVLVYASQAAMVLGHIVAIWAARSLLAGGEPIAVPKLLAIAVLYAIGAALGIHEWRRRKLARSLGGPDSAPG